MKTRLGLLIVLTFAPHLFAQKLEGVFEIGGKKIEVNEIAAFRMRDQFNPRQKETYVMLTKIAVNKDQIKIDSDPYSLAINDPAVKNEDYISFFVKADGTVSMNAHVGGTQYVDTSGKMMGMKGSLSATCTSNTAEEVACTVSTAKPVNSIDGPTWSVKFDFDTPILSRPPGRSLAKGGAEIGRALLQLYAAQKAKKSEELLLHMTEEERESYKADWRTPEENLKSLMDHFEYQLPKSPKITGGELLDENNALLEVEGVPYENGKMLYLVEMGKRDGQWRYQQTSIAGMLK